MALFSTVWSSQEITNFGTLVLRFGDTSHQPKKNSKTLIEGVERGVLLVTSQAKNVPVSH